MKRTRHTPEQLIRKLKIAELMIAYGKSARDSTRVIDTTLPTSNRWRQQVLGDIG